MEYHLTITRNECLKPVPSGTQGHCCCLVAQYCFTLCDPMDCNTSSFPFRPHFPELTQTRPLSWWCHPTISSSVIPFSFLQSFPASGSFLMSQLFASGGQSIGASASASVLPKNIQDWFSSGLTGLISLQSKDSQESSPTSQFKSINSSALSLPYSLTLTSIHDYWKNHSFDYRKLCRQSTVFAF